MRKSPAMRIDIAADWQMPLSPEQYDRRPTLTQAEREALAEVIPLMPGRRFLRPEQPSTQVLARLTRPLQDIYGLKGCDRDGCTPYLRWMYQQMLQMNKPFWVWSKEEWLKATSGANSTRRGIMVMMRVTAYLLCDLLIITDHYAPFHLARIVFGSTKVSEEYEKIAAVIFGTDGFGYVRSTGQQTSLRTTLVFVTLVNRNPPIDALTLDSLRATKQLLGDQTYQDTLRQIARALVYLNIVGDAAFTEVFGRSAAPSVWWEYTASDVDPTWLSWVQAYAAQTNRGVERYQKGEFYRLIIAGRWLKQYHPTILEPAQWDESLGYEYVSWVCQAKMGEFMSEWPPAHQNATQAQVPLQARTIDGRISAVRRFFNALQRRPYRVSETPPRRLVLTFDPNEVLATPENIKRQIIPNPRTLDPAWWQKLTWAAASLSAKDLAAHRVKQFSLAYYRAAGLVWVTGARRADEIRRLKVGCVSREWAPEMHDEYGNQVEPEENLAF